MKSHTSLIAQQTRLSEWADLIRDCQNCPQGMKIDAEPFWQVFRKNGRYKPDLFLRSRWNDCIFQ